MTIRRFRLHVTVDIDSGEEPNMAKLEDMARMMSAGLKESDAFPNIADAADTTHAVYFVGHGADRLTSEPCECDGNVVAGTLYNADTGTVERCDSCQRFDGDVDAALAVANALGAEAWVFVHREGADDRVVDDEVKRLTPGLAAGAGVDWVIAEGTDPWIVVP